LVALLDRAGNLPRIAGLLSNRLDRLIGSGLIGIVNGVGSQRLLFGHGPTLPTPSVNQPAVDA
jgi:hypothetical protein